MHDGTHSCILRNSSSPVISQNLAGQRPRPFNNFKEIGYAPAALKSTKHYRALNAFPPDAIRNIGGHISMQEFLLFFYLRVWLIACFYFSWSMIARWIQKPSSLSIRLTICDISPKQNESRSLQTASACRLRDFLLS